jgi:hypothetical protein
MYGGQNDQPASLYPLIDKKDSYDDNKNDENLAMKLLLNNTDDKVHVQIIDNEPVKDRLVIFNKL